MKAEFASWRLTGSMKFGEFGTEGLRIREFRAHIFEIVYDKMADRQRAFEFVGICGGISGS